MVGRVAPFWFKRLNPPVLAQQRSITLAEVQTPGTATSADIIGLYTLDDNKNNLDPNTLALYGSWAGTPETYSTHLGVLSDNGFSKYLDNTGLQKSDWSAGTLDTYYNTAGITLSWIARLDPATGTRLMQYWQADLEYIELYFLDVDTLRLSVSLGTATIQSADVELSAFPIADNTFHHFLVSFHPGGDRIARLYINGTLAASTAAVTGVAVFGDEVANIRRAISFGSSYSATNADVSGDVDHATILLGIFTPTPPGLDNRMMENGIFMKYFGDQMFYFPAAAPIEGNVLYGIEDVLYAANPATYPSFVFVFSSGVPQNAAYD